MPKSAKRETVLHTGFSDDIQQKKSKVCHNGEDFYEKIFGGTCTGTGTKYVRVYRIVVEGIMSFILALFGLGVLVLVHEIGHYIAARRVGMRVEAFGIGFGRPIYSFWHKGVRFNICWIPFGGYVKIAGMEKGQPDAGSEGFFAKKPISRIIVALSGPLFNVLFAVAAFALIWISGGREKSFSDVTNRVGWVDPNSQLYARGVRPGDRILSYNGRPVQNSKDHLYAAMTNGPVMQVKVEKLGVASQPGKTSTIEIAPYQHPLALEKGIMTTGVLAPASFLIWEPQKEAGSQDLRKMLPPGTDLLPGDRILWVDGEPVFSYTQLSEIINNGLQFITILRKDAYLHVRVPRVRVGEIKITPEMKGELSDWQYEGDVSGPKMNDLWFLPYNLTSDGVVEGAVPFLEAEKKGVDGERADKLLPGDHIVSVGGQAVTSAAQILHAFQDKTVLLAVERQKGILKPAPLDKSDTEFTAPYYDEHFVQLVDSIGTDRQQNVNNSFVLLHPIVPRTRLQLLEDSGHKDEVAALKEAEQKAIQAIEDPQMRSRAQENVMLSDKQLFLGLYGVRDAAVLYNPNPIQVCSQVFAEVYQTISALFGGYLSPRWMSGPVGILHVIQQQCSIGYKEALFWLGMISLNLAILNLVPLPVLDGGYVLLSLFEMVTGISLKVETIEKIVLPFAILLIVLLLYLTYHDVIRIFSHVFSSWSWWKSG